MRVTSGVILGYLLFRLLWFALFRVTNTDPHAPASISFQATSVTCGMIFALLAGYTSSFIGGRPHFITAWIAGALVAIGALFTMVKDGISWVPVVTLCFMAPAVVVGGWTYVLRNRERVNTRSEE